MANTKHDPVEVYRWIIDYKRKNDGNSPAIRELADACGIASLSNAWAVLAKLESYGLIRIGAGKARHICVTGGQWTHGGSVPAAG